MKIIIVSYKRPENVLTAKLFQPEDCLIACPKSQIKDYQEHNEGFELYEVPDEIEGNIGRKRNYLLDKIQDDILMLDDDVEKIGYHEFATNKIHYQMNREEILGMIENGFRMCKELGTVLWGINVQTDPRFYWEYAPFAFLSPVLGPFRGVIKNDIRNDESLNSKDDYDYFLQVLQKYHKILRFNKYWYKCGHITNQGGITSYRTMEREMEWNRLLEKKWGSDIIELGRKTQYGKETINPLVRVPIKGM